MYRYAKRAPTGCYYYTSGKYKNKVYYNKLDGNDSLCNRGGRVCGDLEKAIPISSKMQITCQYQYPFILF